MRLALLEAQQAYDNGEIPVGAVMVCNNKIIAKAHNQTQMLADPTAHAEMICITAACGHLGAKYLTDCTLYITLEPCMMCAGAIKWAQIPTIVYGASDKKGGFKSQILNNFYHSNIQIIDGILQEECAKMMKDFFKKKR